MQLSTFMFAWHESIQNIPLNSIKWNYACNVWLLKILQAGLSANILWRKHDKYLFPSCMHSVVTTLSFSLSSLVVAIYKSGFIVRAVCHTHTMFVKHVSTVLRENHIPMIRTTNYNITWSITEPKDQTNTKMQKATIIPILSLAVLFQQGHGRENILVK